MSDGDEVVGGQFVGSKVQYIDLLTRQAQRMRVEIGVRIYGATEWRGIGSVLIVLVRDDGRPFSEYERSRFLDVLSEFRPVGAEMTVAFGESVR